MLVVVSGALANKPFNGGEAWVRLSWLRGFERIGCLVYFLEQIGPETCVDAEGSPTAFEDSVNLAYFKKVIAGFGLVGRAALVCTDESASFGASLGDLAQLVGSADLLVNISGHLQLPRLFQRARRKAYIDIDPGFTQYWHDAGVRGANLEGHDLYYTIGENIGNPDCSIPTSGFDWRPIRQPVVLEDWAPTGSPSGFDRFTTIASWRGAFGPVEAGGRRFGLKVHEFRKVIDLPRRAGLEFEIALDIHPADDKDRDSLVAHGWHIVDPRRASGDPLDFRRYVQQSGAEFSVAQGIYVETNSGWFSDRTVRYLASGRPALVQDTGFSRQLPAGRGLVAFRTLDEAVEGARQIAADYEAHSAAARAIAAEYFDSGVVLPRLLDDAMVGS
jgi:hypothetical protein